MLKFEQVKVKRGFLSMFCPRCGRAINENANFCGGCGLSRAEIEKFVQASKVTNDAAQPAEPTLSAILDLKVFYVAYLISFLTLFNII